MRDRCDGAIEVARIIDGIDRCRSSTMPSPDRSTRHPPHAGRELRRGLLRWSRRWSRCRRPFVRPGDESMPFLSMIRKPRVHAS
jgi:hypothetical protein